MATPIREGPLRVALVHDALVNRGGAERLVGIYCQAFPDAPLYTTIFLPERTHPALRTANVRPSVLQGLIRSERMLKTLFPLALWAMERQVLRGFDVVLSSSTYAGKFVRVAPGTVHVCYCHTPFRLAWDPTSYARPRSNTLERLALRGVAALVRPWDRRATARIDHLLTNSEASRARIRRAYGRDATVFPSSVDCKRYQPGGQRSNRFLTVSRLEPYKRVDLVVEAFNRLGEPLSIIGAGSQETRLRAMAGPSIEFRSDVPDGEMRQLYATARALIMPQVEDFGLVALEAVASGTPVIAYGVGGVRETMIPATTPAEAPRATALFFPEQTAEALVAAVRAFAAYDFRPDFLRGHAERFDTSAFIARLQSLVEALGRGATPPSADWTGLPRPAADDTAR